MIVSSSRSTGCLIAKMWFRQFPQFLELLQGPLIKPIFDQRNYSAIDLNCQSFCKA